MRHKIALAAGVAALVLSLGAVRAEAFPPSGGAGATDLFPRADVIPVAQGCGPGGHRGPSGGCRPNMGPGWRSGGQCWWHATPWGPRRICR